MDSDRPTKPLDTFPIIRSRDSEEVRDALMRSYGAGGLDFPDGIGGLDLRINHWQSRHIGLSYCSNGARVQLDFPDASFFRQQFSLRGSADIKINRTSQQVTRNETFVVPPDTLVNADYGSDFEQFVLRISRDVLLTKLAALIDAVPRHKLEFEPTKHVNGSAVESLRRIVMFFATELDSSGPSGLPPLALAELEQAVIVSFLTSNANNYSALLDQQARPAASWQVRRAEEYIEAHWNQPITMEALADATSASARSIFYHFKQSRGQSPIAVVKGVRLRHARRMLARTETSTSVTEIAFACGFNNLGHFARDYLKRFGERPSDTIKRAKGGKLQVD
jgi:AraC-like DNA-binding protein